MNALLQKSEVSYIKVAGSCSKGKHKCIVDSSLLSHKHWSCRLSGLVMNAVTSTSLMEKRMTILEYTHTHTHPAVSVSVCEVKEHYFPFTAPLHDESFHWTDSFELSRFASLDSFESSFRKSNLSHISAWFDLVRCLKWSETAPCRLGCAG